MGNTASKEQERNKYWLSFFAPMGMASEPVAGPSTADNVDVQSVNASIQEEAVTIPIAELRRIIRQEIGSHRERNTPVS